MLNITNIRDLKIKAKMRYYLTPIRMAIVKKTKNKQRQQQQKNKCWQGCGEIGTFVHYCWECKMVSQLWKIAQIPQTIKNSTT